MAFPGPVNLIDFIIRIIKTYPLFHFGQHFQCPVVPRRQLIPIGFSCVWTMLKSAGFVSPSMPVSNLCTQPTTANTGNAHSNIIIRALCNNKNYSTCTAVKLIYLLCLLIQIVNLLFKTSKFWAAIDKLFLLLSCYVGYFLSWEVFSVDGD